MSNTMSFENLTTNTVYKLKPGDTIIMGRKKYGLESPYISRKHLEVSYLEDHRCFVKRLAKRVVMLNKAALPVDKEIQVQNEDVITLRLTDRSKGDTVSFKFNVPVIEGPLFRVVSVSNQEGGRYQVAYDAHNKQGMAEEDDPFSSATRITGFESEQDLSASELSDESDLL